jgi:lipocalin
VDNGSSLSLFVFSQGTYLFVCVLQFELYFLGTRGKQEEMGVFASGPEPTAVVEVNIVRYAGTWYELATLPPPNVHHTRPERNVVLHYTAKQSGASVYIESTRQATAYGVARTFHSLLLPNRRHYPVMDGDVRITPGYFLQESTDGGSRHEPLEYLVAALDAAEYRYALVLYPQHHSAVILSREKTLRQSEWAVIRNELARQFCTEHADIERHIKWTAHDGTETPLVADESEPCALYM